MRVLLTGGGTAGHINPALAIAELIRRNAPGAEIAFVGIRGGKEDDLIPREGYRLYYVKSKGIRRSFSPSAVVSNVQALWLAAWSPHSRSTRAVLDEFRPDIVIGTGGYACWPIMAAAARRGIPTALHESNALPGLAVRKLQKKVDRIWINFEGTAKLLDSAACVRRVGNPLRGGLDAVSNCMLSDYIYDMPLWMSAADLAVTRAGAMTLSELGRMWLPSVLIPSPHVADNHQYLNAKTFADAGAAVLVEEKELESGRLTAELDALLADDARLLSMSRAAAPFAQTDAGGAIWEDILALTGKKEG